MKQKKRILGGFLMFFLVIFLYAPIVYTVIFSFNDTNSLTRFGGFSTRWFEKMASNDTMINGIIYTVVIAVIATFVSTVVGTLTAIGLSKSNRILRNCVEQVNQLPMMNPDIVTAIGLLMFFSALHIEKGFLTLLLAHIMFCIPYVILSIMPKLRSLDPNLAEAAMDLGATPIRALVQVIIPQVMPGIISGALIAFTMSFDDFVISYFATGNGVNNISIVVYTMRKRTNPSINALSTVVIVLITVGLIFYNVFSAIGQRRREKEEARLRAQAQD